MKKRILAIVLTVLVLASILPLQTFAASYPRVITTVEAADTIIKSNIGIVKFMVSHEYKHERLNIEIYDSDDNKVGYLTEEFYNTSYLSYFSLLVNTNDLDMDVGKYKVKYWMEFYTFYSWHTAPKTYTHSIEVLPNTCKGKHKFKEYIRFDDPTCEEEGSSKSECTKCGHRVYNTLPKAHNFGAYTVTKNPTPTKKGVKTATCKTCGAKDSKSIPTSAAVKITTQPKSKTVKSGKTAKISVKATGDGLKYTWYVCDPGKKEYKKSSVTGDSYSVKMTSANSGRKVYCIVTDKYGNTEKSKTVLLRMTQYAKIVKQPTSVKSAMGKVATVKFDAVGDGLTYKWYIANKGKTKFTLSSNKGDTYSTKMSKASDGRRVYCVITDKYGNSVKTKTVTISHAPAPKIKTQPKNVTVKCNESARVSVTATGTGKLNYQWYVRNAGESTYKKSSVTKSVYTTTMKASTSDRKVYCVITDNYGNSVKTKVVTLKATAIITQQPKNVSAENKEDVTVSVKATGKGLKYQWYICNAGKTNFSKSSATSNVYSTTMKSSVSGRKVYCVVTDKYGTTIKSKTVTLSLK